MAQAESNTQFPMGEAPEEGGGSSLPGGEVFAQGMAVGRQVAETVVSTLRTWADEKPERLLLVGLAAGFVLGKLFTRPKRIVVHDED